MNNMTILGRDINIFRGNSDKPLPIVYLHNFMPGSDELWKECLRLQTRQFILVEISKVHWDDDMTPWPMDKLFEDDNPSNGKAGEWLEVLTGEIIPEVEKDLKVTHRIIAGYSLAGLFALWSVYNTDVFDAVVSGSGSFWYPGFTEYAESNFMKRKPDAIYLSLGDKEHISNIPVLTSVEDNTRNLAEYFSRQGITTVFQLNNGNHYYNTTWRMAKGIQWILRNIR